MVLSYRVFCVPWCVVAFFSVYIVIVTNKNMLLNHFAVCPVMRPIICPVLLFCSLLGTIKYIRSLYTLWRPDVFARRVKAFMPFSVFEATWAIFLHDCFF